MTSDATQVNKSPVRRNCFSDLQFTPRFEYGHMAEASEICGARDGSRLSAGFARMKDAYIPWTIRYDEVLIVFEGKLRVHTGGEVHELCARDSLWLPAGTELIYEAEQALVAYAIHPSDWHEV